METQQQPVARPAPIGHLLVQAIRACVRRGLSAKIRSFLLSGPQYDLLCRVSSAGTVSRNVADELGISISSASGRLANLEVLGYLERREETDPTGGTCYVYRPVL